MSISIEMQGTQALKAFLERAPKAVKDAVWGEMYTSGLIIEGGAKERCPVRKIPIRINGQLYSGGRLRTSIVAISDRSEFWVKVCVPVKYGIYVELGTRKMTAQPFLYPAFEKERPTLLKNIEAAIEKALGAT